MRARFSAAALLASSFLALAAPGLAMAAPADGAAPASLPTASADAPPPAPPPVPMGKLPDAVIPAAYRLDLTVDPAQPRFSGHVEIDAMVKQASRFVYLHGRDLAMRKATATIAGRTISGTWAQVDPTGVALLTFPKALPAGPVTFAFDYDAAFQDGPAGLFRVKVGDDWYGWSQFESIDARAAYPGFDQPGYKQPFTVTLRTPPGLTAVSNTPETSAPREGGLAVHHFAQTLPLPTYLLAVMVGPFAAATGAVPPTPQRDQPLPLRIVSTRQNAGQLAFALANTQPIITHLEAYFGQSFPYAKLDQITSPVMPGAMENAGADLYEDSILVLDDAATTAQKRNFGMVVAHELSHQWFGDLVTPAWWDDIWLNESFANWMGFRIGAEWRPDLNIGSGALAEGFAAMQTDSLLAGRPIHQPITRNGQIDAAFDTITYGKGGHVVAMIAAYMGDDKFREGVRRYMAAHRYGNATSADFFRAMAEVSGDPLLLPAMQGFTDQQGVPLLTFTVDRTTPGTISFSASQSRYARLGTTAPDTQWLVPLCVRVGDQRTCHLEMPDEAASTAVTGVDPAAAVFMPNAGGTGYYRFELPAAEWRRLIDASASLPAGEALALADSLRASFMAGHAHASDLAHLARVMSANPDSYAADAALDGLESLDSWGLLDVAADEAYRAFVDRLYQPVLAGYGFDPHAGAYTAEDPERSQRRTQLVARLVSTARDRALRHTLLVATKAWLAGNAAALDPAWYGNGFEVWLGEARGDTERLADAHILLDRALASQDPLLRPAALHMLGTSGSPVVARWLLNDMHDPRLRLSERLRLVSGVAAAHGTQDFGYLWMRDHLTELLQGGGGIFFASRLPQVLSGLCSEDWANAIARDFGPALAGKPAQLELERTVERVRSCGVLNKQRGDQASAEIARLN